MTSWPQSQQPAWMEWRWRSLDQCPVFSMSLNWWFYFRHFHLDKVLLRRGQLTVSLYTALMLSGQFDVVIMGAGLAGLSLSRHLLMYTDKRVLLLDKLENPPGKT